jgi:hypothetical protein
MNVTELHRFHKRKTLQGALFMKIVALFSILILVVAAPARAQSHGAQKPDHDRLGLTCALILAMTSTDWVARSEKEKGVSPDATVRALAVYGKCYHSRTRRLTASLDKSGKGPLMGARGDFRDFEQALSDFTAKALGATEPPADAVKSAKAALYSKQFRYEFYLNYKQKSLKPAPEPPNSSAAQTRTPKADDTDPMTQAKNRFGKLLDALPESKLREIHRAFGKIFSGGAVADDAKLAVYRYAIFCLESPSATPFSPPPF